MSKENKPNTLSNDFEKLNISNSNHWVTRSRSILQSNNTVKVNSIRQENEQVSKKVTQIAEIEDITSVLKNINNTDIANSLQEKKKQDSNGFNAKKHNNMTKTEEIAGDVRKIVNTVYSLPKQKESKKLTEITEDVSADVENIVCREEQIAEIKKFLIDNFNNGSNANMYISGKPGTGKTSVTTNISHSLQTERKCRYHLITCMDFDNPMDVYLYLWEKLSRKVSKNSTNAVKSIENYLCQGTKDNIPVVIVFDEVDQLAKSNQKILYRIFKWAELSNRPLIIIGIANTLDLTTNYLLESYLPHHINFPAYTREELHAIILSHVNVELSDQEKLAVTLCCKKEASKNGDARMALNLYRLATTKSEEDELSKMRAQTIDREHLPSSHRSPPKNILSTPQLLSIRRSQFLPPSSPCIKHVAQAIKHVERLRDPYQKSATGKSTLPLHHKLVLCAASVVLMQQGTTLGQLYDQYSKGCGCQFLEPLDMGELVNICNLLEGRALMRVRAHKEARMKTFTLNVDIDGIRSALADNALLTSITSEFCPEERL